MSPTNSSSSPPIMTIIDNLDTFTRLFLLIIFLALFIRVCYVYFFSYRGHNRNDTSTQQGNDKNTTMGLPIDVINSYHTFPYTKDNIATINFDHDTTCCICISDYMESEMLRMMPQCHHYFIEIVLIHG
ncbi:Zinc finger, RING/FYVE/PHD-type [Sesbania bispinosa]|nr:Zinc finger, RING/FYVE/PHD-type [Sesbania bispinosa]